MTSQMNDAQKAAIAMGVALPLFPTRLNLICVGCSQAITGRANDSDDGWLCDDCEGGEATACPTASRMFRDWSVALREASSPEHRDSEELLTSYAGAVGKALDRHLQECPVCLSSSPNVDPTESVLI